MINVNEIFSSFQGEGNTVGKYSLFIRFPKCNLGCDFCDTQFKFKDKEPQEYSLEEIEQKIISEKHYNIVFTGGEPLLYINEIRQFFPLIEKYNLSVEVETNGILSIPEDFYKFHFSISPKVYAKNFYKENHFCNIPPDSIFKFPVDKKNIDDTLFFIEHHQLDNKRVYLMPICKNYIQYIEVANFVLKICLEKQFNFSTRLHIIHYFE